VDGVEPDLLARAEDAFNSFPGILALSRIQLRVARTPTKLDDILIQTGTRPPDAVGGTRELNPDPLSGRARVRGMRPAGHACKGVADR
jgi:hypothetical protein